MPNTALDLGVNTVMTGCKCSEIDDRVHETCRNADLVSQAQGDYSQLVISLHTLPMLLVA